MSLHPDAINALVHGDHGAPFDVLGLHPLDDETVVVRAFRPTAKNLYLVVGNEQHEMARIRDEGLFEIQFKGKPDLKYRLRSTTFDGREEVFDDPYICPPLWTDFDLYLWSQGTYLYSYERFGAHPREVNGVKGVNFSVWAPNAQKIAVVGSFNNWDSRVHPMRRHGDSGVWELFIPGVQIGESYKFELRSQFNMYREEKADPYAFYAELRPHTASRVFDVDVYSWHDTAWMTKRASSDPLTQPMAVYEVHLGSWRRDEDNRWLTYRELADELIPYVKHMNFTHIELMPVAEHPFDGSWGYQVTGYYAPTSRFGTPEDFMYFIDQCHQAGLGIILDWVPAHFPKDGFALSFFDGTHLYSHEDPRQGEHPDWGTYIFNYGRNEIANFLISNALFWLEKYHIDGLRVDAVSSMLYLDFGREEGQWIPNEYGGNENLGAVAFLKRFNEVVHEKYPGAMTIAEESTAWAMVSRPTYLGGLGFTLKWNMGWMHDTLSYIKDDPVYRRYAHNKLTFSMMYAFSENFVLSLSHDEVVHGKGSLINKIAGDWWQKFATLRLLWGYQYTHPGKKLNFMGQEFGQWNEWNYQQSLDWHLLTFSTHEQTQNWVRDLNALYRSEPALYEIDFAQEGFEWIEANDADNSVFSYIRYAEDRRNFLLVVCNFTPVARYNYRVGVPVSGYYDEVLNSDSAFYGGGNVGNAGGHNSDPVPWHQHHQSLDLTLPPLGIVILKKR